jgi:hypothetical protein
VSARLADRTGSRGLPPIGLIACIGLVLLSRFDAVTPTSYLVFSLVVVGWDRVFQSPNSSAIMSARRS